MILSVFLSSYFKHTVATSITELRWKVHGILTVLSYFIVHAVLVTWKSVRSSTYIGYIYIFESSLCLMEETSNLVNAVVFA